MIAVIHRPSLPRAAALAQSVKRRLELMGRRALIIETIPLRAGELPPDTSLILSLGGDGTILDAVRLWAAAGLDSEVAIIGVNLGGVGFLTVLSPEQMLSPDLAGAVQGLVPTQLRTLLEVEYRGKTHIALNEVVAGKAELSALLDLEVQVDGRPLLSLRADGLIVATSTGASAYNLSAGGPICHPRLDCMVLTPICSFNFSNRPLVLPPDMELTIKVSARSAGLACDGQILGDLTPADQIKIRRAPRQARLGSAPDFFEILRNKLKWG
jgi:NAD+ kinase